MQNPFKMLFLFLISLLIFNGLSAQSGTYNYSGNYTGVAFLDFGKFSILPQEATFENPGSFTPLPSSANLTRVPPILAYYQDKPDFYGYFNLDYIWSFITSFMFQPKGVNPYGFDHSFYRMAMGKYFLGKKKNLPVNLGIGFDFDIRGSYMITTENLNGSYDHEGFASVGVGPNVQMRLNFLRGVNITPSVSEIFYFFPKYGSDEFLQGTTTSIAVPVYLPAFKSKKHEGKRWGFFLRPEWMTGTTKQIGVSPLYYRNLERNSFSVSVGMAYYNPY